MSGEALRIGVCGVGTVGLATIDILRLQGGMLSARAGKDLKITHVGARRNHAHHDYGDARVRATVGL